MFHRRKVSGPKPAKDVTPPDPNAKPLTAEEKEAAAKAAKALRMYFNAGTQAAIVAYQSEPDKRERERLYVNCILPAFSKLAENLINIHKFSGLHDTPEELKNDCVNFLFETIRKFDSTRGTNAFSYFNVVAKNWLIIRTKQKALRSKRSVSLDDPDSMSLNEQRMIEEHNVIDSHDETMVKDVNSQITMRALYEVRAHVKNENELACVNSIITIFENVNDIDIISKGAIMLYMRELSGLSPKQMSTALSMIKRIFRRVRQEAQQEDE